MQLQTSLSLFFPDKQLIEIAQEVGANKCLKKHDALSLFKLLLYSHIMHDRPTLRAMESDYRAPVFKACISSSGLHEGHLGKSSISDLLSSIPCEFYERIFEGLVQKYRKKLFRKTKNNVVKIDSTFTSISNKLLKCEATPTSKSSKRQIKVTIVHRDIPEHINFHFIKNNSDEKAFKKIVFENDYCAQDIVIFDRGMQSRRSFIDLDSRGIAFITRLQSNPQYKVESSLEIKQRKSGSITIISDYKARLVAKKNHWTEKFFRVVEALDKHGKKLFFVTNRWDLSANKICKLYKSRWQIEIFFKYLKSYLNGRHFLSRNENGIKTVYYIRLIAAILLTLVGKAEKIKSFKKAKIASQLLLQELAFQAMLKIPCSCGPPLHQKKWSKLMEGVYE